MSLKKDLKSLQAQAVIEYALAFSVMALACLAVFKSFGPEKQKIIPSFDRAINNTINYINRSK